jgi:hypothetical protein
MFHWVDGAWHFEVIDGGHSAFVGQVDLGLHYVGIANGQIPVAPPGRADSRVESQLV